MKKRKKNKTEKTEEIPSGSNWKEILLEIYHTAPHLYGQSHYINYQNDNHPIAKKIKITGKELDAGILFLLLHGLIEENNKKEVLDMISENWSSWIELTEKGFQVALDIEKNRSETRTNNAIVLLTSIIAFTGAASFLFPLNSTDLQKSATLLVYASFFIIIFVILKRKKTL
ncbi:MAG: hypothetical protein JW716_04425 [Candidatus Aenigmarchaeota archaeon]|nr:hypothetical protein [Candidatus Aenigmarchaeota archaeon]